MMLVEPTQLTGQPPVMTSVALISMRVVQTLADAVTQAGVPAATFLRSAHLDPVCLQTQDGRVPNVKLYELMERAIEVTGDPAFALHSIERMTTDALNPLAALVAHAATLRHALESIQDFRGLLGDDASFRVYEEAGKVYVVCNTPAKQSLRVRRYLAEVSVAGLYRVIRRFRASTPVELVAFAYAPPEYAREYARVFEGRARFDQVFTGLCFDDALMSARAPQRDAEQHDVLRGVAARRSLRRSASAPYAARVHDVLVWQRAPRDMTMEMVARKLGLSVRSLRRYLTAEGKPYAELVSSALAQVAKTSLLEERRSISDTAHELGFADNTTFHRAFKRWTGLTPSEYRQKHALLASEA